MGANKAKINKYLKIEKSSVYAKTLAVINLDLTEYKNVDPEYAESVGIEEIDNVYKIPGFFTLEFPEKNDSIDFFFPYSIYLHKTSETEESKDRIRIEFDEGELIFHGTFKDTDANISLISSIFENGSKYLGNNPDKLISSLWQQLENITNVSIQHLEVLISQLYGDYDKSKKMTIPLRLTGKTYNKKYIMNMKTSSHELNQGIGFTYGYSKDALRTSVSQKKKKERSFFENVMGSDYDALVKASQKSTEP